MLTLLLRAYTTDLTVLTLGQEMEMPRDERRLLHEAGIRIIEEPVAELVVEGDRIVSWHMRGSGEHRFDTIYSALGTRIRSGLAIALGAQTDEDGALIVDAHMRTTVPGLYAAGDVVHGLSQIAVAAGQAAIAATDMNASFSFPRPEEGS